MSAKAGFSALLGSGREAVFRKFLSVVLGWGVLLVATMEIKPNALVGLPNCATTTSEKK